MKAIRKTAAAAAAVSALALLALAGSPAQAGPIVPPGHYCMTFDIGGSDCSFTSYEQCLATASGIDAQCWGKTWGKTARNEEKAQNQAERQDQSKRFNARAQAR